MNPAVTIVEIKEENVRELIDLGFDLPAFLDAEGPQAELGGRPQEALLATILRSYAAKSTSVFFLDWKGSKIPRGATIRGRTIAWTQNGVVTDDAGAMMGTYERLVEFGPQDRQQMLVYYIGKAKL
jgi:hypothetical protein